MFIAYGLRSSVSLIHLNGLAAKEVLEGYGLGRSIEYLQQKDVVDGLTKLGTSEVMQIIELFNEQFAYRRKPLRH